MNRFLLLIFGLMQFVNSSNAQPGCPFIDAGPNQNIACNGSATLNATVLATGQTTSYGVTSIPYNPPYPFNSGTPIFVGIDDIWTGIINLPFNFCFYGSNYSQIVVGSNGLISFDLTYANGYCPWSFTAAVPNATLPLNSIFGVYHDIDPSVCGNVRYAILGNYPCRTFVVSYDQVCHFDCNNLTSTTQIVLYETTNVIEVYVQNKPTCISWNDGNALIGIQDAAGTTGIAPPGRNTGPWSANNEAWRFTPNGPPNYVINWYDNGVLIGSGPSITVSPSSTTTYTAEAIYTNCNGAQVVVTDVVTVTVGGSSSVTVNASSTTICDGQSVTITANGTPGGGTYSWNPGGQTSSSIVVSPNTTTTYVVSYNYNGCIAKDSVTITVNPVPTVNVNNATICNGGTAILTANVNPGGGTFSWVPGGFTTQSISVSPGSTTTYTVTYTLNGCTNTASGTVTVGGNPSVVVNSASICSGQSATLTATPNPGGGTYSWVPGGQTTQSITVSPSSTTTYTVTYDLGGCIATGSGTVTVNPNPVPSFTYIAACPNQPSSFNNTSTILSGTISYQWSFPGATPNSSTQTNPSNIVYPSGGSYTVTLVVTSNNGCVDSITQQIVIPYLPVADYSVTTVCEGTQTCYTDLSSVQNGNIVGWQWVFGDGSPVDNTQNPCHLFNLCGTYNTTLIATSNSGCAVSVTKQVVVECLPTASFTTNNVCRDNFAVFNNTSSGGSSYSWNFGDGFGTSTQQNPTYLYNAPGTYNVMLTVNTVGGCSDVFTLPITIFPEPTANFNFSNVCEGNATNFTDASTIGGGGSINQWNWNFGNSNFSTQQNPSETYANDGSYLVTLITTSADGCKDTISKLVEVYPLPTANFTATSPCEGTAVVFTNTSNVPSGSIIGFNWSFGVPGGNSSQQNPSYNYNQFGTYNVTLTVTTNHGCTNTITIPVTVNPNPLVQFVLDTTSGCSPLCVNMQNLSTIAQGNISSYLWNLGNGNTAFTADANACYENQTFSPISITISLTVTSDKGCSNTFTETNAITIYPNPKADFDASVYETSIFDPQINFFNYSSGATAYLWLFGDGQTSIIKDPKHDYGDTGFYNVTLIASNSYGCVDEITKKIRINPEFAIYIPNSFTPDVDNLNEIFRPKGYGIVEMNMYIFDRWGEIIYEGHELTSGWDGMVKGRQAKVESYPYRIIVKDINLKSHVFIGHVTLVR